MAQGHVTRGWSGLTVQPRLEADGAGSGVVDRRCRAGRAGRARRPPARATSCWPADGHLIEGAEEKAVARPAGSRPSRLPGNEFVLDYRRAGEHKTARLKLVPREGGRRADNVELRWLGHQSSRRSRRSWPATSGCPTAGGVWVENIRPAGPSGQAEPELRHSDVIVAVDGQPVAGIPELRALTDKLLPEASHGTRPVLVSVRRDGALLSSVVELRRTNERHVTAQARKAWLGAASQPLTVKLATRLGIKSDGGARLTRIYPGTQAESAGLRVGDVVLALDGAPVTARRPEDTDLLARQIRQYKPGTPAVFTLWRDGQKLALRHDAGGPTEASAGDGLVGG